MNSMSVEEEALSLWNADLHPQDTFTMDEATSLKTFKHLFKALCLQIESDRAFRHHVDTGEVLVDCDYESDKGIFLNSFGRFIVPVPVDPLLIEARELVIKHGEERTRNQEEAIRNGNAGQRQVELVLAAFQRMTELREAGDATE